MSTLRVNAITNQAGTTQPAIDGTAKAWVNFNGTGTVAIRRAFNVSSITDNGTGHYTVNFTNALSDGNYSTTGSLNWDGGSVNLVLSVIGTPSTTAVTCKTVYGQNNASYDALGVYIAVFS